MGENRLVGEQIQRHVRLLMNELDRPGFRFVELVAPSGAGKSRTIREFYRLLASQQVEPAYWPKDVGAGDTSDPVAGRKVIGPPHREVSAAAGAVPPYLWLSICPAPRADGAEASTLPQLVDQFLVHELPLVVAALSADSGNLVAARLRDELIGVLREGATEVAGDRAVKAVEELLDFALPGASTAVGTARRLVARRRERHSQLTAVADGHELKLDQGELAERLRDRFIDVQAAGLKTVLVIEDAHLMDRGLARLLKSLHDHGVEVLVVASAWPEGRARREYADVLQRVSVGGAPSGFTHVSFDSWAAADLRSIVQDRYPHTSDDVVNALVERFRSPLSLLLCLSLEKVQARAREGRLDLSVAAIHSLSNDPEGLMRQRWRELDGHVQEALTLTMAMTGSQGFEGGLSFVRDVVVAAGSSSNSSVGQGLDDALHRVQWLVELIDGVDGYREPLVASVVQEEVQRLYWEDELSDLADKVWSELEVLLARAVEQESSTPQDEVVARWARALSARVADAAPHTPMLCDLVEARACLARHDATAALELLERARPHPGQPDLGRAIELLTYAAQRDAGRLAAAIETGRRLREQEAAEGRPADLMLSFDLAHWKRTMGMLEEARADYAALVEALTAAPDSRFEDLMVARIEYACACGYLGDAGGAEAELAQVVADCRQTLGASHPLTLRSERSRWRWAGTGGRLVTACTALEELWHRMQEQLGPDHPSTLFALSNLAAFTSRRGDHEEARAMLDRCADGRRRSLGPLHPHTIDSLRNGAREASALDDHATAVGRYEALLSGELASLDPESPLVLSTRLDLAISQFHAGYVYDGSRVVGELAAVIGPDPTRAKVMGTIGEYGDVALTLHRVTLLGDLLSTSAAEGRGVAARRSMASGVGKRVSPAG